MNSDQEKLCKAIHAQECKTSAKEKAKQVEDKLLEMKLTSAAKKVEDGNPSIYGFSQPTLD